MNRVHKPLEVSVHEAAQRAAIDFPLIDIRSSTERQTGTPTGALALSHDEIFTQLSNGTLRGGCLICAAGFRSNGLAQTLRDQGHAEFFSVGGGFNAWKSADLPTNYPSGLDSGQAERYARHLVIPQVGPDGQARLLDSRVLLVGLGGLNSPAALYLASAGVGVLGLVDDDQVELSNLQRQIVHADSRVGIDKTVSAATRISELNPDVRTKIFSERVTSQNADRLVSGWDVVIDGTDNFAARYALNDACVNQRTPLIYGAVMRFQGQVSVFWPSGGEGVPASPCFRCFTPNPPAAADTPSCAEAGVLGVLPGMVGTLQAAEALKILLHLGEPLIGKLLMFDVLNMDFRQTRIKQRTSCVSCGSNPPG